MAVESNWKNCESESITKDLINMRERMEPGAPQKFIPTYPAWARDYAVKFGLVEGKDFVVSEIYMEVK